MKTRKPKFPKTDSVKKLAEFWDTHDVTDFENDLDEMSEPVFIRDTSIEVALDAKEAQAIEHMARAKGVSREELVRAWVVQKVARCNTARPPKRRR